MKPKGLSRLEHFHVLFMLPVNVLQARYLLEDNYKTIFSNLKHELQLDFCPKYRKTPLWKKICGS